jgi:hypothetical protein
VEYEGYYRTTRWGCPYYDMIDTGNAKTLLSQSVLARKVPVSLDSTSCAKKYVAVETDNDIQLKMFASLTYARLHHKVIYLLQVTFISTANR